MYCVQLRLAVSLFSSRLEYSFGVPVCSDREPEVTDLKSLRQALKAGATIPARNLCECSQEAVRCVFESGQVAPANLVVKAALRSKGNNADRLIQWMKRAVPHNFDEKEKVFRSRYSQPRKLEYAKDFFSKNPDFRQWKPPRRVESGPGNPGVSRHVRGLRRATSEIVEADYEAISESELRTIQGVIADLNSIVNGTRLVRGASKDDGVTARFFSGGLPSLGKKRR